MYFLAAGLGVVAFFLWLMYEVIVKIDIRLDQAEQYIKEDEERQSSPWARVVVKSGNLVKATEDAACYDVLADADIVVYPGEMKLVTTGIVTEMFGCDAFLFDKSGLALKFWLTRRAGVIDEKYPEEWGVVVANEGREEFRAKAGKAVCQALFLPKFEVEVSADPNGTGSVTVNNQKRISGFGSTGV